MKILPWILYLDNTSPHLVIRSIMLIESSGHLTIFLTKNFQFGVKKIGSNTKVLGDNNNVKSFRDATTTGN